MALPRSFQQKVMAIWKVITNKSYGIRLGDKATPNKLDLISALKKYPGIKNN